jgi:hypothetical protein
MAPAISLITAPGFDAVVYVRRGSSYTPCKSGMLPAADSPCEPGANATDPDGLQQIGGSTSAADLTDRVVVCPPAACTSRGCSPVELRRHYFSAKGLQGCGIDTSRPEGTQFKVCLHAKALAYHACGTVQASDACCCCADTHSHAHAAAHAG